MDSIKNSSQQEITDQALNRMADLDESLGYDCPAQWYYSGLMVA